MNARGRLTRAIEIAIAPVRSSPNELRMLAEEAIDLLDKIVNEKRTQYKAEKAVER